MSGAPGTTLSDKEVLDWLEEQVVDVIHLDDGRVIDVAGSSVRKALARAASMRLTAREIERIERIEDEDDAEQEEEVREHARLRGAL